MAGARRPSFRHACLDDDEVVLLLSPCGTEKYLPPEMLAWIVDHSWVRRSTTVGLAKQLDTYALGTVAYLLLSGCFPFNATTRATLVQQQQRVPRCNSPRWEGVSTKAISFVQRLLDPNPAKRMSAKEALQHPFLREAAHWAEKLGLVPRPAPHAVAMIPSPLTSSGCQPTWRVPGSPTPNTPCVRLPAASNGPQGHHVLPHTPSVLGLGDTAGLPCQRQLPRSGSWRPNHPSHNSGLHGSLAAFNAVGEDASPATPLSALMTAAYAEVSTLPHGVTEEGTGASLVQRRMTPPLQLQLVHAEPLPCRAAVEVPASRMVTQPITSIRSAVAEGNSAVMPTPRQPAGGEAANSVADTPSAAMPTVPVGSARSAPTAEATVVTTSPPSWKADDGDLFEQLYNDIMAE